MIKPLELTRQSVWASDDDNPATLVCRSGLEAAFGIKLPKNFKRIEIDVEVTRFEYE